MFISTDNSNVESFKQTPNPRGFEMTDTILKTAFDNALPNEKGEINFKEMFESLSVIFYIVNLDPLYKLEYVSPAFQCLGYTLEEIYAHPKIFDLIIHPDDLVMINEQNKSVYDGTMKESSYAYRVSTKDGEQRWWKDHGRPIFNENGDCVKWFGVIYDITERKQMIEDLQKANEKLEQSRSELAVAKSYAENIMDSMVDFVVVVDMDLTIRRVNPATLKLNGYREDELIGKSVNMLMADRPYNEKGVNLLRRKGYIHNLTKLNRRKDGSVVPISMSMCIIKDENGEEAGIVCVGKDITEIVKTREEIEKSNRLLRQSNRELQDFAYVASHDLQEPLRKVQAFGDRLQKKFANQLTEEGSDYIYRMRDAAIRMQRLINDLLTFSRVTSKAQPFKLVDVKKIAEEVVSDLEVRIEQTNAKVEIGELPAIDADAVQIRQLLQNLIGNALKFQRPDEIPSVKIYAETPEQTGGSFSFEGEVIETVGNSDQTCTLVVEDNGIGFDEKYLEKIFTVFQRLHGRTEYEGSGIGLAVCRKIVERHNGSITARSEPDKGATFLVTLPIAQINEEIKLSE